MRYADQEHGRSHFRGSALLKQLPPARAVSYLGAPGRPLAECVNDCWRSGHSVALGLPPGTRGLGLTHEADVDRLTELEVEVEGEWLDWVVADATYRLTRAAAQTATRALARRMEWSGRHPHATATPPSALLALEVIATQGVGAYIRCVNPAAAMQEAARMSAATLTIRADMVAGLARANHKWPRSLREVLSDGDPGAEALTAWESAYGQTLLIALPNGWPVSRVNGDLLAVET